MSTDPAPPASHGPDGSDRRGTPGGGRVPHKGWLIFFGVTIVVAALAFGFKFYEFFYDLSRQEGFRFAGAHLATYLLVAGGFFLLLLFAFLRGHFSDIEKPKHDMLEQERRYDEAEYGH